jgi:putative hydroxymethylpyrimidine transport system permease protein
MKLLLRGAGLIIGLICLWQLAVVIFKLPSFILPSPKAVFLVIINRADLIANESLITISETLIGLFLGILLGSLAAIVMSFFRSLSFWILPILIVSQALPTFAIAPLLVIWFGYGMASKIATTLLMIFFPITSAFYDGLRQTKAEWLDLANIMQAKKWRTFLLIRIPSALPTLATGIRVATVAAPIGAVIGEWVGASKGLGFLMLNANARMQIDLMFAALFTLIIFSLLLYFCVDKTLKKAIPWTSQTQDI